MSIQPVLALVEVGRAGCCSLLVLCAHSCGLAAPGRLSGQQTGAKGSPGLLEVLWAQDPPQELWHVGSYRSRGLSMLLVLSNCQGRAEQLSAAGAQQSSSAPGSCARAEMVPFLPTKPKLICSCSAVHSPRLFTHMHGKMPQRGKGLN